VRQWGVAPPEAAGSSALLDSLWAPALAEVTGEPQLARAPSAGKVLGNLLTVQLAEDGLNSAFLSLPLDRQEGEFEIGRVHPKPRRGQSCAQLRMEERGGAPLLVHRAEHRSSSASPSQPGGHDERPQTGDGSIAKGAPSIVGRCVFVCRAERTGASGALITLFTSLSVWYDGTAPSAGRCAINPPTLR
jgi:hypothetical protein